VIPGKVEWSPDYRSPSPKTFDPNYDRFKRSRKEEKRIASRLGGRVQPGSGNRAWSKSDGTTAGGDLTTKDLHLEHKRAEPRTQTISIKREWLRKVTEGASRRMRIPAMGLTFEDAQGHAKDWVVLPLEFVERLLKMLEADG
jgi:hypothetical protein